MKKHFTFVITTIILSLYNPMHLFASFQIGSEDPLATLETQLNQNHGRLVSLFNSFRPYALIIAAFITVVGIVQVYSKIQKADRDAAEKLGWWFGAIAFLFFGLALIPALFLGETR